MKINENVKIIGDRVILVPYKRHHVAKYHEWMMQTEIQELTASEPLTIDEEYEMQKKWQQDEDKLTFIILSKDLYVENMSVSSEEKEIQAMVGDVNGFVIEEEHNDSDSEGENQQEMSKQVEMEVMIVDKANRGCGYGSEAVFLMMNYIYKQTESINFNKFLVKIGEDNLKSIEMFERLGFVRFKYIKPFKQVCLKFELDLFNKDSSSMQHDNNRYRFFKDFKLNTMSYE